MASVAPIIALVPVASPSNPSVILAPLETANYNNYQWNEYDQVYFSRSLFNHTSNQL